MVKFSNLIVWSCGPRKTMKTIDVNEVVLPINIALEVYLRHNKVLCNILLYELLPPNSEFIIVKVLVSHVNQS